MTAGITDPAAVLLPGLHRCGPAPRRRPLAGRGRPIQDRGRRGQPGRGIAIAAAALAAPSTVLAAYHAYGAGAATPVTDKEIRIYAHNGHEGGGPYQVDAQLDWLAARFA